LVVLREPKIYHDLAHFARIRIGRGNGFDKAVQNAGIVDFRFHDLRHCAINNLRLAGNDHFKIKKASGHKTDIAFQRYNLVTEEEMLGMKWFDLNKDEHRTMDTYMDT